jgi:hypothetical protein
MQKLRNQMDADLAKSLQVKESFNLSTKDRIMGFMGKYVW